MSNRKTLVGIIAVVAFFAILINGIEVDIGSRYVSMGYYLLIKAGVLDMP